MSEILKKIRSRGYWEYSFRPTKFKKDRIENITLLFPILQKSSFQFRGWDLPHIPYDHVPKIGADWIEDEIDLDHFVEYWRFFQSGQFFHACALANDWRDQSNYWPADDQWKSGDILPVGYTLFMCVGIFEFAARLSMTPAYEDGLVIQLKLANLQGRRLFVDSNERMPLSVKYETSMNSYDLDKTFSKAEIVSKPRDLGIDLATEIFRRFNWDPNRSTLQGWADELKRI